MILFEKIRWKNFLSTGNQYIEIELDHTDTTLIVGTNGAGKSTVLDALTFSLFNKPFRKISKSQLINSTNEKDAKVELDFAIEDIVKRFNEVKGVKLLGIPPTDNYFFANKIVSVNTFCIGDMLFVKPSDIRFDTQLTLKEDYDFTLQHRERGDVIRYQKYLFTFEHYSNIGGAVDVRDDKEEQKNIRILKSKWGDKVRLNSKRKNEILI